MQPAGVYCMGCVQQLERIVYKQAATLAQVNSVRDVVAREGAATDEVQRYKELAEYANKLVDDKHTALMKERERREEAEGRLKQERDQHQVTIGALRRTTEQMEVALANAKASDEMRAECEAARTDVCKQLREARAALNDRVEELRGKLTEVHRQWDAMRDLLDKAAGPKAAGALQGTIVERTSNEPLAGPWAGGTIKRDG